MPSRIRKLTSTPVTYSAQNPQPSPDDKEPIRDVSDPPEHNLSARVWMEGGSMIGAYFIDGRWWDVGYCRWIEPVRWQRIRDTSMSSGFSKGQDFTPTAD